MKILKRWMNLNRMTKKILWSSKFRNLLSRQHTDTYAVTNSFTELAYFSPIRQNFSSHFFPFRIFCNVPFSFDMAKHILWNLKNGIKWTQKKKLEFFFMLRYSTPNLHGDWLFYKHLEILWKNSFNNYKHLTILLLCFAYSS